MKKTNNAKEIAIALCFVVLTSRFPAYAHCPGDLYGWQQAWGCQSMAGWLKEGSPWNLWPAAAPGVPGSILKTARDLPLLPVQAAPKPESSGPQDPSGPDQDARELTMSVHPVPRVGSIFLSGIAGQEDVPRE